MFARITRDLPEGVNPYVGILHRGCMFWRVYDKRKLENGLVRFTLYVVGTAMAIAELAKFCGGMMEEVI